MRAQRRVRPFTRGRGGLALVDPWPGRPSTAAPFHRPRLRCAPPWPPRTRALPGIGRGRHGRSPHPLGPPPPPGPCPGRGTWSSSSAISSQREIASCMLAPKMAFRCEPWRMGPLHVDDVIRVPECRCPPAGATRHVPVPSAHVFRGAPAPGGAKRRTTCGSTRQSYGRVVFCSQTRVRLVSARDSAAWPEGRVNYSIGCPVRGFHGPTGGPGDVHSDLNRRRRYALSCGPCGRHQTRVGGPE